MSSVILHHVTDGPSDAPVLLMSGSLGSTLQMWEPQLPALTARHRVVRVDHRGHGGSPAPSGPYTIPELGGDVLALMDRLGLDRVAYVGLSIGGMVGQWLGIHAPERIRALTLICTTARFDSPDPWRERAVAVRAAGTPGVIADAVVARWFTDDFRMSRPDIVARCRAMVAGTDAEGYAGCCEAIAGLDLDGGLGEITAPTLVITGAQDTAIPAAHGRRIAQAIAGARYQLLDPAAHVPSVERAETVSALIADHLTTENA